MSRLARLTCLGARSKLCSIGLARTRIIARFQLASSTLQGQASPRDHTITTANRSSTSLCVGASKPRMRHSRRANIGEWPFGCWALARSPWLSESITCQVRVLQAAPRSKGRTISRASSTSPTWQDSQSCRVRLSLAAVAALQAAHHRQDGISHRRRSVARPS